MHAHSNAELQVCSMQASKKQQLVEEDSEGASGSDSGSGEESEDEQAKPAPAPKPAPQNEAKSLPQQSPKAAASPPAKLTQAAAKAPPKGVRARLEQSAAAAREAELQLKASDSAADVVIPAVRVAESQPEPVLAPSASPTLPYDSADLGKSATALDSALPDKRGALEASNAPDVAVQQSVFGADPLDSIDKIPSAIDPDFFAAAAPAAVAAEESAESASAAGLRQTKKGIYQQVYKCT